MTKCPGRQPISHGKKNPKTSGKDRAKNKINFKVEIAKGQRREKVGRVTQKVLSYLFLESGDLGSLSHFVKGILSPLLSTQ